MSELTDLPGFREQQSELPHNKGKPMNRDELIERMVKALKPYLPRSGVNTKLAAESVLAAHESYLADSGYRIVKLKTAQDKCDLRDRLLSEIAQDVLGEQTKCVSVMHAASIAASQRKGEGT